MNSLTLLMTMKKITFVWAAITASLFAQEILRPTVVTVPALDPVIITLIGGMIVTVISAIVTGIVTVITALRQRENATKIDSVAKDTEAIKGHVNSEKTAGLGREETLRKENELLRAMVIDGKTTAALLAQAVAQAQSFRDPLTKTSEPTVVESLSKIDTNTAAIEKNTARTETSVNALKDKA